MLGTKSMFASKGVIGAVIAMIAMLLPLFGYVVDGNFEVHLTEAVTQIIGGLGALLALYGRITATEVIE